MWLPEIHLRAWQNVVQVFCTVRTYIYIYMQCELDNIKIERVFFLPCNSRPKSHCLPLCCKINDHSFPTLSCMGQNVVKICLRWGHLHPPVDWFHGIIFYIQSNRMKNNKKIVGSNAKCFDTCAHVRALWDAQQPFQTAPEHPQTTKMKTGPPKSREMLNFEASDDFINNQLLSITS